MFSFPKLGISERKTFNIHLLYSIIEGFIYGLFVLNEFIFIKSLQGSNFMLSYLFMFSMLVLLPTVFINEIVRRTRNKKKMLRITAVITRFPLIFIGLFPATYDASTGIFYHIIFLAIFLNYYLASPMIFPTINQLLKNTYSKENFGKLYSYATGVNKIVAMIATFIFGLLLDYDNFSFRYVYPFVSVLGIASIFFLTKIEYNYIEVPQIQMSLMKKVKTLLSRLKGILFQNKAYRDFEAGFMLYGFSFMLTVSVITIFLVKELDLSYSDMAFYKNGNVTLTIILLPFFGRLIGKIDPRKFAIITYLFLALYIFFVGFTGYFTDYYYIFGIKVYFSLFLAFMFFGLFASSMTLLWSIGSSYFCKDEDAAEYQAIHLSLTGLRAAIAPVLGVILYELFGFDVTFGISIVLLIVAMFLMRWSMKKPDINANKIS